MHVPGENEHVIGELSAICTYPSNIERATGKLTHLSSCSTIVLLFAIISAGSVMKYTHTHARCKFQFVLSHF